MMSRSLRSSERTESQTSLARQTLSTLIPIEEQSPMTLSLLPNDPPLAASSLTQPTITEHQLAIFNDHQNNQFCTHYQKDVAVTLKTSKCEVCLSDYRCNQLVVFCGERILPFTQEFKESNLKFFKSCKSKHNILHSILICFCCLNDHKEKKQLSVRTILPLYSRSGFLSHTVRRSCDNLFCNKTNLNQRYFYSYNYIIDYSKPNPEGFLCKRCYDHATKYFDESTGIHLLPIDIKIECQLNISNRSCDDALLIYNASMDLDEIRNSYVCVNCNKTNYDAIRYRKIGISNRIKEIIRTCPDVYLDPDKSVNEHVKFIEDLFKNKSNMTYGVYVWLDGNQPITTKNEFESQFLYIGKAKVNVMQRHLRHLNFRNENNDNSKNKNERFKSCLNFDDGCGKLINFFYKVDIDQEFALHNEDCGIDVILEHKGRFPIALNCCRTDIILNLKPDVCRRQVCEFVMNDIYQKFIKLRNDPNSVTNKIFQYKEWTLKDAKKVHKNL